jgi:protein tyrosine phosphatase
MVTFQACLGTLLTHCDSNCSDRVGRTVAFIATHAEMERMKAETVVDLFQFIKGMRVQRVGMVSNQVQL